MGRDAEATTRGGVHACGEAMLAIRPRVDVANRQVERMR